MHVRALKWLACTEHAKSVHVFNGHLLGFSTVLIRTRLLLYCWYLRYSTQPGVMQEVLVIAIVACQLLLQGAALAASEMLY